MSRLVIPRYTVIKDTREKKGFGWEFKKDTHPKKKPPQCDGTISKKLDTGDYSAVGYEDILAIERKEDLCELWINYGHRDTFESEMLRMSLFKHKMIIIESSLTREMLELTPPQFVKNMPGKALIRWLIGISAEYGVHCIYAGQCGKAIAQYFIEEVIRLEKDRWIPQEAIYE